MDPFRELQALQAVTQLEAVVPPPFERGRTWSIVSSSVDPQ